MSARPLQPGEIKPEYIPSNWPIVLLGAKKNPLWKKWTTPKYTAGEFDSIIEKEALLENTGIAAFKAVGIISGPLEGKDYGLCWVDIDGESVYKLIEEKSSLKIEDALPPTLTIKSGKPGRERRLYRVPQKSYTFFQTPGHKTTGTYKAKYGYSSGVAGEQLEILWVKKQAVAMGAHPETEGYFTPEGLGFEWCEDLPKIPAWVLELLDKTNEKYGNRHETTRITTPQTAIEFVKLPERVTQQDLQELVEIVKFIYEKEPEYFDDRENWVRMGMGFHSVCPEAEGLEAWDTASQFGEKYTPGECHPVWASFTIEPGGITQASLYKKAIELGLKPDWADQQGQAQPVDDAVLEQLLVAAAKADSQMNNPMEDLYQKRGGGRTWADLQADNREKRRERKAAQRDSQPKNPSEPEILELVLSYFAGNLAWSKGRQRFFQFSNGCWRAHEYEEETHSALYDALLYIEREQKQLPQSFGMATVEKLVKTLKGRAPKLPRETKGKLLFQNGVLDIKTGVFDTKPSRDLGLLHQIQFKFDPTCGYGAIPDWLKQTQTDMFWPAEEAEAGAELLRAFLRMVLIGYPDMRQYLEITGPARTGKSQFQQLCIALVGWTCQHSTDMKSLESERFETAQLMGKKLLTFSDQDAWGGSCAKLKAATGRDPLRAEYKNVKDVSTFVFEGHVLVVGNQAMQSVDKTTGLSSRRIFVPFNNQWKGDAALAKQLIQYDSDNQRWSGPFAKELSGLANWLLDMSESEMRRIMESPGRDSKRLRQYNREQMMNTNPIADFVNHLCIYAPGEASFMGRKRMGENGRLHNQDCDIFPAYLRFCEETGVKPMIRARFKDNFESYLLNELELIGKIKIESGIFKRPDTSSPGDMKMTPQRTTKYHDIVLRTSSPTKYAEYPSLSEFMSGLINGE